jgi:ribose transport system substrate-binding protein
MKKILALVLALMLVLGTTAAFAEGMHIEIVSKGFQHSYWQAVKKGAEEKAAELGVTVNFVGPANESAYDEQLQQMNSAIAAAPAAIGLAALSTETLLDPIAAAQAAGIPIIGFDSGVPGAPEGAILANAATNNYNAGAAAADNVYALIADKIAAAEGTVRIGVIAQDNVSESVTLRGLGFIDKMAELCAEYGVALEGDTFYCEAANVESAADAKVIIETLVPAQVTAELSLTDANTILSKADTVAIYGSNQHSAEAIVSANENLQVCGPDGIIAAGFDSGAVILGAVREGIFAGAITQAPLAMGGYVVELCVAAVNGEEVSDVDTGCQWYTAENMDDPEIAPNLYE